MAQEYDEVALVRLLRLVDEYRAGRIDTDALRAALAADEAVQALARRGGSVERDGTLIAFGDNAQLGDLQIRDVAGRDIVHLTINYQGQSTATPIDDEELAHKKALIAQHRRMLHALELQAAKFGIHAPPHITIEIEDLKRKIRELQNSA